MGPYFGPMRALEKGLTYNHVDMTIFIKETEDKDLVLVVLITFVQNLMADYYPTRTGIMN